MGLWSVYDNYFTIKVYDQYGQPLSSIYANSPVSEGGYSINRSLNADGTYSDQIGLTNEKDPSKYNDGFQSQGNVVPEGSPAAQAWKSEAMMPVYVPGGPNPSHIKSVTPAINGIACNTLNRSVTALGPNSFIVHD